MYMYDIMTIQMHACDVYSTVLMRSLLQVECKRFYHYCSYACTTTSQLCTCTLYMYMYIHTMYTCTCIYMLQVSMRCGVYLNIV